jgi:hypothetical protein
MLKKAMIAAAIAGAAMMAIAGSVNAATGNRQRHDEFCTSCATDNQSGAEHVQDRWETPFQAWPPLPPLG